MGQLTIALWSYTRSSHSPLLFIHHCQFSPIICRLHCIDTLHCLWFQFALHSPSGCHPYCLSSPNFTILCHSPLYVIHHCHSPFSVVTHCLACIPHPMSFTIVCYSPLFAIYHCHSSLSVILHCLPSIIVIHHCQSYSIVWHPSLSFIIVCHSSAPVIPHCLPFPIICQPPLLFPNVCCSLLFGMHSHLFVFSLYLPFSIV